MSDSSIAIICSSVVSIISVCIPLITLFLTNKHSKNMKEFEITYENKLKAYQEFFSEFGKFISVASYSNLQLLGEKVSNALIFATPQIREKLFIILQFCESTNTTRAIELEIIEKAFLDVTPLIANDLANSKLSFNGKKRKQSK